MPAAVSFDPEAARGLVDAGAAVILVLLVGLILLLGYRFAKSAWERETARADALAKENVALRASVDANTAAMQAMSASFVKAIDELADELRWDFRDRFEAGRLRDAETKRRPRA